MMPQLAVQTLRIRATNSDAGPLQYTCHQAHGTLANRRHHDDTRMPRSWILILLLSLFGHGSATATPNADAPSGDSRALRVMSFNVRTPIDTEAGRRWQDRRTAMASLIRNEHPDVIGTQELVAAQADDLLQRLPNYQWFGRPRTGDGDPGDEHVGVFYDSRTLRPLQNGDFWLSDSPDTPASRSWGNVFPRLVTWALFERRSDGRRFYLFNTHLPYRPQDATARLRSAQLLRDRLRRLPADIPVVVTGDFNSEPDEAPYKTLTSELGDARKLAATRSGPRATFHDFTGQASRQLDWILLRGLHVDRFTTLDQHPGGLLPSDHFPLLAELRWP